jgi:hypothetical protein
MNQSGCRLLFLATGFKGASYVDMVDAVRPELTLPDGTIYLGSPQWDELCAWIRLRDGQHASEDDIKEFCRGKLAHSRPRATSCSSRSSR